MPRKRKVISDEDLAFVEAGRKRRAYMATYMRGYRKKQAKKKAKAKRK